MDRIPNRIDVDGNYLIIEQQMPDQTTWISEIALKNSYYLTSSDSFVIGDLIKIQQSITIQFDDVHFYTNFDGMNYTIESFTAFLRKTTGK